MKKALDAYSGVRGYRAAVVSIDSDKQEMFNHNWKGIQAMSNFEFTYNGVRMWKVYNTGEGKCFRYDKLQTKGEE